MEFTVKIEVQVTAESFEEAGRLALDDLRDPTLGPWYADVSSAHGQGEVEISGNAESSTPNLPRG